MFKSRKKVAIIPSAVAVAVLCFAGVGWAHNVVAVRGYCISPTSAGFEFTATQMGDGDRTITVTGNGDSGSITTNTNGTKTVTLTHITPQTGNATFSWTTTAVAPNGTPDIVVDFSSCQPPVYEDSATVEVVCVDNEAVLKFTVNLDGPADNVVVYSGNGQEHELGAKPAGTFTVTYPASVGESSVNVMVVRNSAGNDVIDTTVNVDADECAPPETTPTTPPTVPPTNPTTPPSTVPPTNPTTPPSSVNQEPPTPTAPPTTVKAASLPATGSNDGTYALIALGLLLVGIGIVLVARRPDNANG